MCQCSAAEQWVPKMQLCTSQSLQAVLNETAEDTWRLEARMLRSEEIGELEDWKIGRVGDRRITGLGDRRIGGSMGWNIGRLEDRRQADWRLEAWKLDVP